MVSGVSMPGGTDDIPMGVTRPSPGVATPAASSPSPGFSASSADSSTRKEKIYQIIHHFPWILS